MRLFLGTSIPPSLADAIHRGARSSLARGNWRLATPRQWHVTSLFIGERHEAVVAELTRQVEASIQETKGFTLENGALCTMPRARPSMLWIRFDPHPAHRALHERLAAAVGMDADPRDPFWPHITLARKRGTVSELTPAEVLVPSLPVDHLTLFRSDPSGEGTVHTPLRTWPLRRTDPVDRGVDV